MEGIDIVSVIFGGVTAIVYQRLKNQALPGWQAGLYSVIALLLAGVASGLLQAAGTGGAVSINGGQLASAVGGGQLFYNALKMFGITDLISKSK